MSSAETEAAETETDADRYVRLYDEHHRLRRIHPDDRIPADCAAMSKLADELEAILEVPPAGYSLPPAARRLIGHAHLHGWQGLVQWYPAPGQHEGAQPFVRVCVGRYVTTTEAAEDRRGNKWEYVLTWHSRDCQLGRLRRFGQGHAVTPDNPAVNTAPSIAAITAVIAAHPGPDAA